MKRREKKSESLDIRLPYQQKQDFMAATKQQGETASQALRRFIADYIEEARLAEQPHPVQEISMTLARHRFKTIATAAGAALGVFSVTALPSAADANAFDVLDKNKDGFLTEGEIIPGYDADIIEKLDTDGSGGVSQEELEALQRALEQAAQQAEENPDGEPEQMSDEELAELRRMQEQEQAMEQWLRRIPNDPGGLLRRKFRYQYQRMGKDQDGNDLWPDDEVQPW